MKKIYAVYFAYSKYEVLPEEEYDNNPTYPSGIARIRRYKTAGEQLNAYANTCCAASQMFEADSEEEAREKVLYEDDAIYSETQVDNIEEIEEFEVKL